MKNIFLTKNDSVGFKKLILRNVFGFNSLKNLSY